METAKQNDAQLGGGEAARKLSRLKPLLDFDPDNPGLARECVDLALQAGDFGFVVEQADRVLAHAPGDARALFDRASGLLGMREYRQAAVTLGTLLEREPGIVAARFNLGLCHYCLGEYAEARAALQTAYASGDRSAALLRLLVSSCHHLGLIDEAVRLSDENPAPAQSDPELAGTYALLYLDAERADSAARWAAATLAKQPDSVDALVVQGTLEGMRMEVGRAKGHLERALRIAPATGRAWIGLGTLALLEKDFARAREQITRGLELMPNHLGSWHVLAWTHLMSNELDAAESVLQRALALDHNFAETHGGLAAIQAIRGNVVEAQRGIDVALRLDPQCLSAQLARSILVGRAGKPAEAQQIIQETLAEFSTGRGAMVSKLLGRVTRH